MPSTRTFVRNLVAGACIAAMPISTTAAAAATRPNAAVPAAGSTAVAAQSGAEAGFGVSWAALAVVAAAIIAAIWISVSDDSDGEGSVSLG